jgi:hypothetical protein
MPLRASAAKALSALCQPPNKQLQPTVRHKVPRHMRQRAAAELRRYAALKPRAGAQRLATSRCLA